MVMCLKLVIQMKLHCTEATHIFVQNIRIWWFSVYIQIMLLSVDQSCIEIKLIEMRCMHEDLTLLSLVGWQFCTKSDYMVLFFSATCEHAAAFTSPHV